MTREQLKLPAWAVPILISAFVAVAVAWATLGGKEDASAHAADVAETRRVHAADVVTLQSAMADVRSDTRVREVRDSAWKADAMRILLDLQRKANR